jgi:alpha-ribazole phosphatase
MKITLIRHGLTEGNIRRLYYGATDLPLLPESEKSIAALAESGFYPTAERYYTSGLLRAEQTFRAIYGDAAHEVLPALREMDFGDFEMRSYEELMNDPAYIEWITGDNEANIAPNGESGDIVTERALKAISAIAEGGSDAVIVTHGGVIGGVLSRLFPDEHNRFTATPEPGGAATIDFENGKAVSVRIKEPHNDN